MERQIREKLEEILENEGGGCYHKNTCSSNTDLQVQQKTLCNQSESGPVSREKDYPLFLEEAGQYLKRAGSQRVNWN